MSKAQQLPWEVKVCGWSLDDEEERVVRSKVVALLRQFTPTYWTKWDTFKRKYYEMYVCWCICISLEGGGVSVCISLLSHVISRVSLSLSLSLSLFLSLSLLPGIPRLSVRWLSIMPAEGRCRYLVTQETHSIRYTVLL